MARFLPKFFILLLRSSCAAVLILLGRAAFAVGLFHIELTPGAGLQANPDALASFQRAAAEWEAWISSPITIHIDADLSFTNRAGQVFDPNVIGSTSFTTYSNYADINLDYTTVRDAMAARANRPGNSLLEFLPTSLEISAEVPSGATLDHTTLGILRANQRALGLLDEADTRADGLITFNPAFTFDYNRDDADGVAPGKYDFQTAAAHEIGHLLGFLSDVDDFDTQPGLDSDNLTTLDLFRFPANHVPTTLLEFRTFARELTPGVASVFSDISNSYPMSTGSETGDGNQASHWQDDFRIDNGNVIFGPLVGLMDPTLPPGQSESVGAADIRAVNLMGYDVVPEPATAILLLGGSMWLLARRGRLGAR